MIVESGGKNFPKADPGIYLARVIDVVELGLVAPKNPAYKASARTRLFFVLNSMEAAYQGKFLKDPDGRWFTHMEEMPTKMTPQTKYQPSRMYRLAEQIFGGADKLPVPFDDEFFLGRANQIVLSYNGQNSKYRTITSVLPVPKGLEQMVPPIPEGFIRARDRKAQAGTAAVTSGGASVQGPTLPQTSYVPPDPAEDDLQF